MQQAASKAIVPIPPQKSSSCCPDFTRAKWSSKRAVEKPEEKMAKHTVTHISTKQVHGWDKQKIDLWCWCLAKCHCLVRPSQASQRRNPSPIAHDFATSTVSTTLLQLTKHTLNIVFCCFELIALCRSKRSQKMNPFLQGIIYIVMSLTVSIFKYVYIYKYISISKSYSISRKKYRSPSENSFQPTLLFAYPKVFTKETLFSYLLHQTLKQYYNIFLYSFNWALL